MDTAQKLGIMQNTYAAVLAETVNTYAKLGALDGIVAQKRERQKQTAPYMARQLGVESLPEVFTRTAEVFGCANWQVEPGEGGYVATATACKLAAYAKKMGGANPCRGWCLDPMAAMAAAVSQGRVDGERFAVESTLMDGECCRVVIRTE